MMQRLLRRLAPSLAALVLVLLLPAAPTAAGDIVDELRLGILAHDVGVFGNSKEDGVDFNGELLFASPAFLRFLYAPRPHLGITVNSAGDTSQLYAGLTWTFYLFRDLATEGDGIFLDAAFGGAVHDGKLDTTEEDRKSLGTRVLFRGGLELGYSFGRHSISAILAHVSNANLGNRNEGLDNVGLRYGLKF